MEIKERSSVKKQKVICKCSMPIEIVDEIICRVELATRYHRQIPNQPFVVLTSHHNERFYLFLHDSDQDDNFKVNKTLPNDSNRAVFLQID
jgi:hypothetical protein